MFITHYEVDGKTTLVLAKKFMKEIGKYAICDYSNVDETVNKYLDTIEYYKNTDSILIITDISISRETANRIEELKHMFNFLLLIDHHPSNNYYLNKYEWCQLGHEDTSSTKIFYNYLTQIGLIRDDSYDELVTAVDEWDTMMWEATGNEKSKIMNDLAYNLKTNDFLNRFMMNPSLELSKKEKLILGIREEEIQATISKIQPTFNGNTCYVFVDKFIKEISEHIFVSYPNVEIIILVNPVNGSVSYRSRDNHYDVSEIAKRNGGNGRTASSGSKLKAETVSKIINLILEDGYQDYTQLRLGNVDNAG